MNIRRNRMLAYYSGFADPVYELYKLKKDIIYAKQRYSSWENLVEYGINPSINDYELCEMGVLNDRLNLYHSIELLIQEKNMYKRNTISVGDIITVFQQGKRNAFFVDSIGLKRMQFFF